MVLGWVCTTCTYMSRMVILKLKLLYFGYMYVYMYLYLLRASGSSLTALESILQNLKFLIYFMYRWVQLVSCHHKKKNARNI